MWKSGRRFATDVLAVVEGVADGFSRYSYIMILISKGSLRSREGCASVFVPRDSILARSLSVDAVNCLSAQM